MMRFIAFEVLHLYDSGKSGISVPAQLSIGTRSVNVVTKLDTGATHCIFQRVYGDYLGLDIESGYRQEFHTTNGTFFAYGHQITLSVLSFDFDSVVYFTADENFTRDVLGRHRFLDRVCIGIKDYQGELYLSRNNITP